MAKTTHKKDALGAYLSEQGIDASVDLEMQEFSQQIHIAEVIYAARMAVGLTQAQLAQAIGTKQQVISQLESADYQGHSLSMIEKIAKALHHKVQIRLVPEGVEQAAS
jgi:ribosome-binding protein aMBF1 (putative translation factor)